MVKAPKSRKYPAETTTAGRDRPSYLYALSKCENTITTTEGVTIEVWELKATTDAAFLAEWASTFRQHYCLDDEIDELRNGTGLSRAEYLEQLIFPDPKEAPGPAIRAGDFAELLISDYVEYFLNYWVPRGKYAEKAVRNESVKGVDILGFRLKDPLSPIPADTLLSYEVKAQCTGTKYSDRLQNAIDHSSKDYLRRAMTLNATKRRLLRAGQKEQALRVERFQNLSDHPYVYRSGAAAVLSDDAFDEEMIRSETKCNDHTNRANLELLVIRGSELMQLVHQLYERAAHEA